MKRKYFSVLLLMVLVMASVSFLTSCKDYANDISNLQDQVDKAALSTDVQTLKAQVEANAQKELATADTAKKAFDKAVANAAAISSNSAAINGNSTAINGNSAAISGNTAKIEAINKSLDNMNTTIQGNAEKAASRIDSLARAGAVTDTEIAKLQSATKAAADSAAYAILKNKELFGELADLVGKVGNISDNVSNISDSLTNLSVEVKNIQNTLTQWAEARSQYYTANEIDNKLDILAGDIEYALNDLADLRKTVEGYQVTVNALYTAVTGVYLVEAGDFKKDLIFLVGTINPETKPSYTFGAAELDDTNYKHKATPTYTYVSDDQLIFPQEILIRVNPVNAKVDKDMIRFFDSKGGNLDNLLEVASVTKYDQYLTRASETGLWCVKLQLKKPYDSQTIPQTYNGKKILYALGINNTLSQTSIDAAADRYVLSDYDLTVGAVTNYTTPTVNLDSVKVNGVAIKNNGQEPTIDQDNNPLVEATNGVFEISFEADNLKKQVDRFYVVLDEQHVFDKNPGSHEPDVWQGYEYTGLNRIVKVENGQGKDTVTVAIPSGTKDEVQFRIFAVNYDGTLVEKNGRAFRVQVGSIDASVEGDLNFVGYQKMETDWLPVSATFKDDDWEPQSLISKSTVTVRDDNQNAVTLKVEYAKDSNGTQPEKDSEVKFVKFSLDESLKGDNTTIKNWLNGGKAVGIVSDNNHPTNNVFKVTLTKKMPTVESTRKILNYQWKESRSNGVYTAYVYPYAYNNKAYSTYWGLAAKQVYKKMDEAISSLDNNCVITVKNIVKNSQTGNYTDSLNIRHTSDGESWVLHTDGISLVDNKTQHESVIKYDFGKISSEGDGSCILPVETYQTVLANPLDDSVMKYEWLKMETSSGESDVNYIVYEGRFASYNNPAIIASKDGGYAIQYVTSDKVKPESGQILSVLNYIKATNSTGLSGYDKTLNALLKGVNQKYVNTDFTAKLICDDLRINGRVEPQLVLGKSDEKDTYLNFKVAWSYFGVFYNPLRVDLPATLVITLTDAFGHTHAINMPFTVKKTLIW